MSKLRDFQKRSNDLVKNWPQIRSDALNEAKEIALDVITDDQLFKKGIDGDGNKLPLPYAPFTISIKKALGQPTDRITLKDTGAFYDGFFANISGDNMTIGSSDSKSSKLHKVWGKSISSMTKANTEIYAREDVLPVLQDLVQKALRL